MKIAGVQMDITLADVDGNITQMHKQLKLTTAAGARLTVFPECSTTGYCFETYDECQELAEPIPGPITETICSICHDVDCHVVFGMIEREGDRLFNAAVLAGPEGVVGTYRKVHLPYLGLDRHTTPGDRPFAVQEIDGVKIGLNICYDSAFPEASRCLALLGADVIVLPTNWPPGAECLARTAISTRAMENAVYYVAINRIGTERGFRFIGNSSICDPVGNELDVAEGTDPQILYAEIDPTRSRKKRFVRVPGKHEIDRMADRRPEMYTPLIEPHDLPTPRQVHMKKSI